MVRLSFLVCAAVLLGVCNGAVAEGDDPPVEQGSGLPDTGRCADDVSECGEQAPEEPTGPLTLAGAIELVLLKSPYLEAFSWDVRAAEAHTLQAGLRPNPKFSLQTDEVRWHPGPEAVTRSLRVGNTIEARKRIETPERSGFSDAEITLQLSQVIELGRKRAKRAQLAETECSVAAWDYEVAKAEVLAQMTKDFAEVLALQEHLLLAEERIRYADEALAKLSVHI